MAEGKGSEEPVGQGPVLILSERVSVHREERGGWNVLRYYPFVFREVKNGVNIEFSII